MYDLYPGPTNRSRPTSNKNRRDIIGGPRGNGHRDLRRAKRLSPTKIRAGSSDHSLTRFGGMLDFDQFVLRLGLHRAFSACNRCKESPGVVYPLDFTLHMHFDMFALGFLRTFDIEALGADGLLPALWGHRVPSVDTLYRDPRRLDEEALGVLHAEMQRMTILRCHVLHNEAKQNNLGLVLHLDIDTTVTPIDAESVEGAKPGPNPKYHGRPSYHPILIRVQECGMVLAAKLREGDTGFGNDDVPFVLQAIQALRNALGPDVILRVRMDAAGDCIALLKQLDDAGVFFVVKGRIDPGMKLDITSSVDWIVSDEQADGVATQWVGEVPVTRAVWTAAEKRFRLLALRKRGEKSGRLLWPEYGLEDVVQLFVSNDSEQIPEDVSYVYNGRAGIEPMIAEWKNDWGLGLVSSRVFGANHALLLLKLLAFNALELYARQELPGSSPWRSKWKRRALLLRAGRLIKGPGRTLELRLAPRDATRREIALE